MVKSMKKQLVLLLVLFTAAVVPVGNIPAGSAQGETESVGEVKAENGEVGDEVEDIEVEGLPNSYEQVEEEGERFLVHEPRVGAIQSSQVGVEFETVVETVGAVVYYGAIMPNEKVMTPHYRISFQETLPPDMMRTKKHRLVIDISRLESPVYDPGLVKGRGGVIAYRIEVFDPRINSTRLFNRRFCYKRKGEPKTGIYSLCTTLTEGPFVDMITHNSLVISWKTDRPSFGAVVINGKKFKTAQTSTYHEVTVTGLQPDRQYTYKILYSVEGGMTPEYSFKTGPTPGSQRTFSFGFMSDSRAGAGGGERSINGVNVKVLSRFAAELFHKNAELILFGGDLINGYTSDVKDFKSQLETWKRAVAPVGAYIPFYEIIGNHEQVGPYYKIPDPIEKGTFFLGYTDRVGNESGEAIFAGEFVNPQGSAYGFASPEPEMRITGTGGPEKGPQYRENVYSFNYGNVHFTALNSNYWYTGMKPYKENNRPYTDKTGNAIALTQLGGNREGYMRQNQLAWLEKDLKAAQDDPAIDWIFIYFHEPVFPNGGHVRDAMFWGTPGKGKLGGYNDTSVPLGDVIDMRDRFLKIISSHSKVIAVLTSDEHNYSRTLIDSSICKHCQTPLWQFISGGVGAPYYVQDRSVTWVENVKAFAPSKNYCLFTVDGMKISVKVYSDTDEILDEVPDLTSVK